MSDRSNYKAQIDISHADNTGGNISAQDGRDGFKDLADYVRFKKDDFPINTAQTTGTGAAYAVTIDYPDSLTENYTIQIKIHTTSTSTTPTLTVTPTGGSALAATTMDKAGGALAVGDLVAGSYYLVAYDGANFVVFSGVEIGDVVGPASSTDNAVARYDGTTGKLLQNSSGVTVSDSDVITASGLNLGNESISSLRNSQTFTPTVDSAGGGISPTYSNQVGRYSRVGDMVSIMINVSFTYSSGGSGQVQIKGLPFNPLSSERFIGSANVTNITLTADSLCSVTKATQNLIVLMESDSDADEREIEVTDLSTSLTMFIQVAMTYWV